MTDSTNIILTGPQQAAHEAILAFARGEHGASMMTLEGYAGTGKTTVVAQAVRELAVEMAVGIAAPTNKAVGVLRGKIGGAFALETEDFRSIHSFLGLRLVESEGGIKSCKPEGDVLIGRYSLLVVDEASMIGRELFGLIVPHTNSCRVLFVGDPAQLPPVEPTALRADVSPVFSAVQHKSLLTDVVRQAQGNPIIAMSMRIREAIERGARALPDDLRPAHDSAALTISAGGEATAFNWALWSLQEGLDARIICYTNARVDRYNAMLHAALYSTPGPFAAGERVIVNEHYDDAREVVKAGVARRVGLYTSEELVVESLEPEVHRDWPEFAAYKVVARRDDGARVACYVPADLSAFARHKNELWGEWRRLKADEDAARQRGQVPTDLLEARKDVAKQAGMFSRAFAPLRHCYAMTAHKSQGSTIDTVIVDYSDLDRMRDAFDFNRALYVAVTRAAKHVAVVV